MKRSLSYQLLILAPLGIALVFAGCDDERVRLTFPHRPHHEQEITCDSCHALEEGGVSMPAMDVCTMCHELEDDVFSGCNSCHEQMNVEMAEDAVVAHGELFREYLPQGWEDVRFDHAAHLEEDADCLGCHAGVTESDHSTVDNLPSMKKSMAFNEAHGISNDCSVCHAELSLVNAPPSHDSSWPVKHGKMKEFTNLESCLLCHEEATCTQCHQTQMPRNHTNLWRRKTHGIQAAFDRASCMTCHRNDACESCHRASASPIPGAAFHTPDAQCMACHAPAGSNRPPNRFLKPMPHRLMMGMSSGKCLECHTF